MSNSAAAAPKKELTPLLAGIAGGITGALEISVTYPTEYVKTVMQLNPDKNAMGMKNVARSTFQEKGFFGLYRGYSALLLFSIPKNYVRFGAYQTAQGSIFTNKTRMDNFCCGLFAGAMESTFVVTPQETLKTKLVHDMLQEKPKYRSLMHGITEIIKAQGLGGIYKGYSATLVKQSSNQGVRFVVYTDSSKLLQNYISTKVLCDLVAGGFAGFCSVMANNPVDVIKTRLQGVDAGKYKGFLDCGSTIMKNEGFMGFYSGAKPRLARVILDVALTFSIFGVLKRKIQELLMQ